MSKELRELLEKINTKKAEVRNLAEENKLDEAQAAKEELKQLQQRFDILFDLEEEEKEKMQNNADSKKKAGKAVLSLDKITMAVGNAIKSRLRGEKMNDETVEVFDAMTENVLESGGLTVPQDIRTEIKELRRAGVALEQYVNVEPVSTKSGSRVIEEDAEATPFDNVDEEEEFGEASTPRFRQLKYSVKKKGGIMKLTKELVADTAENLMAYIKKWIAKKSRATRNFLIIAKINEITKGKERTITSLDDFKDIFNTVLDPDIALTSKVFTNQTGFNWLDKIKDDDGNYILQKNPTEPTKKMLFGEYEVVKLPNKVMKSRITETGYRVPFVCGDLKEAITIFDRERMTIDINDLAAGMWERDQIGAKVRERLDCVAVDEEAIIMGEVEVEVENFGKEIAGAADTDNDGTYSEEELNAMTVKQLQALAESLEYTLSATSKAEIIAEIIAAQGE